MESRLGTTDSVGSESRNKSSEPKICCRKCFLSLPLAQKLWEVTASRMRSNLVMKLFTSLLKSGVHRPAASASPGHTIERHIGKDPIPDLLYQDLQFKKNLRELIKLKAALGGQE